jgi:hypothetical protein
MAGNKSKLVKRLLEQFGRDLTNILMAGPMKAVLADFVLLVKVIWKPVQISIVRKGCMKRCIKNSGLGNTGEK